MANTAKKSFNGLSDKIYKKIELDRNYSDKLFDELKRNFNSISPDEKKVLLEELNKRIEGLEKLKQASEEGGLVDHRSNFDNQIKAYNRIINDIQDTQSPEKKEVNNYDKLFELYDKFKNDKSRKSNAKGFIYFWSYIKDKKLGFTYNQIGDIFEDLTNNNKDAVIKYLKETTKDTDNKEEPKSDDMEKEIKNIDEKMEQVLKLINMVDINNQYNKLSKRREKLKEHMQNFNKDGSINADTELFRAIYPSLEYEINEFKKELENAIIDLQEKIKLIDGSGIADIEKVKEIRSQLDEILSKYKNIKTDFDSIYKKLLDRIYKKTPKLLPTHEEEKPEPKPKPIPKPEPEPTKQEDLELSAVISDMGTDVHRERVSLETEEELRDEYKATSRWNVGKKGYLFLSRGAKRKRLIKEKMGKLSGKAFSLDSSLDEKTEKVSDRHELELLNNLDKINKENAVALENAQINQLCKDYLGGIVNEDQFKTQFNTLVDNDANIQNVLKNAKLPEKKKITHIGTNILEKLKLQKASSDLMLKVNTEFEAYVNDKQDAHINSINKLIEDYIKEYQQNPKFLTDYQEFLSNKDPSKLKLFFKHNEAIMKMQIKNLKVKIDVLTAGKSAYQIDNKDRQKGRAYKVGHALDKLPRWAQTAGFVGLSIGTGLITGGLGTVASAARVTGVSAGSVGGLNALKKWTHYTKEQNTHEKNVATDYRNEQKKIKERQDQALKGKRYSWKTYKAKRQLALYDQSTQENFQVSNTITDTITDLCSQVRTLTPQEENYIKKNLIQGKVRLDYYRDIGHNFLASNEKEKIEKDMNRLEKAIILGTTKLGIALVDITSLQATDDTGTNLKYDDVKKDLENSYNKSLIQFKRERRVLAAKYGIGTAVASASMSLVMQYLMGTGVFSEKAIPGTTSGVGTTENFNMGGRDLLDTGTQNNIHNTAQSISSNPNINSSSVIDIHYGAGTDATGVIPGRLTQSMYDDKITEVVKNINSMSGLNSGVKSELLKHISSKPREANRATSNFTNDFLHGMRCAETVEQVARGMADSGYSHGVNIAYDSSYDIVGKGIHNVAERVVNADFVLNNPGTGGTRRDRLVIPVPLFFNTFKDRVLGKKPEDKKQETPNKPDKPNDKEPKGTDKNPEKIIPSVPPIEDKPGRHKKRRKEKGENPFEDDDFQPITPKPFDKGKKIGVTPRDLFFDKTDIKPDDLGKDYPTDFKFKTPEEIANIIIDKGVPLYKDPEYPALYEDTLKIETALKNGDREEAKKVLVESIKKERKYIDAEKNFYNESIDKAFDIINKKFDELGGDRSQLPDKSKVHIVGAYEFRGQRGKYDKDVLGFCSYMNGELFINRDSLFYSSSLGLGEENNKLVQKRLIHTITHEIIHGTSTANYRHQYKDISKLGREDSNNIYPNARRLGAQMRRFIKNKDGSILIKERGRAFNEAITESLTREIIKQDKDLGRTPPSNCYPDERDILSTVCKIYKIDIKDFYKILVNRKNSLKLINKKLEQKTVGGKTIETPGFYTLLMSVMDYEFEQRKGYNNTKALMNGEQLIITPEMKSFFHPSIIHKDKTGKNILSAKGNLLIKPSIMDAYPNILDPEAKAIAA